MPTREIQKTSYSPASGLAASIASVHPAVVLGKMTLEVAAVVKDAADVDRIPILAAAVEDEMARIVYDAERSLSAVAAETDMVRTRPFYHDFRPLRSEEHTSELQS